MKKIFVLMMALFVLALPVQGAVTLTDLTPVSSGFIVNAESADFSACEEIKTAVTGKSIYIERILISSNAAVNVKVGEGETAGNVTTLRAGPFFFAANTSVVQDYGSRPIKLTAATALTVDASGAGLVTVIVQGFIK